MVLPFLTESRSMFHWVAATWGCQHTGARFPLGEHEKDAMVPCAVLSQVARVEDHTLAGWGMLEQEGFCELPSSLC